MMNMQLAMYRMLTNISQDNSSFRIRPIGTNHHSSSLKNHPKPLKRLISKRQRLEKNRTTSK